MAIKRYKGKKSLKQPDEFITFSSRLLKQILLHKNQILAVFGGIIAVALIISGVNYLSRKREADAFILLSQAVSKYESMKKENTALEAYNAVSNDLEKIADAYDNKMGGKLANFYLADACFTIGEFSRAETLYRKAVADFKGAVPFEYLAKSSLGYSLEQQGKYEEAAVIFSEMSTGTGGIMGDESLLALIRQYNSLGNTTKKLEIAKKLIETYPQSIYINVLKEKFPDLEQPES